jgi:hypothetical protein
VYVVHAQHKTVNDRFRRRYVNDRLHHRRPYSSQCCQ